MKWLVLHWREAALVLALGASALLGYSWRKADAARAAWQAKYAATTAHGDSLETRLTAAHAETAEKSASLDSALAHMRRVAAELASVSRGTTHHVTPVSTANWPAATPPHRDTALAALGVAAQRDTALAVGSALADAVESFRQASERALALADSTIDTLHARIDLLENAPKPPRLQTWVAGGYDLSGGAAARIGATLNVSRSWALDADITRRLAAADTARFALWVRHIF